MEEQMTRVIHFTKIRFFTIGLSVLIICAGIVITVMNGGFNLGIDFQAGLSERIQIAPAALSITYNGAGDARLDSVSGGLYVEVRSGESVQHKTFLYDAYPTLGSLSAALDEMEGITVTLLADGSADSRLIITGIDFPLTLGATPQRINIQNTNQDSYVTIAKVRAALSELDNPQIQVLGKEYAQEFLIRVQDPTGNQQINLQNQIKDLLGRAFGASNVVIRQTDYIGPKFSANLGSQAIWLTAVAFVLMLLYIWFRFKLSYAVGAIVALIHDVLITLIFIGVFRYEVNSITIATILTIIGYSINDTIVIFDRIRENAGLMRGKDFALIVDTSITQCIGRSLLTSFTTLLTVLALFFFAMGDVKEFGRFMIVGIISGSYSTIFIAAPIVLSWINAQEKSTGVLADQKVVKEAGRTSGAGEKAQAASLSESSVEEAEGVVIPTATRKLHGKRQDAKKKKR